MPYDMQKLTTFPYLDTQHSSMCIACTYRLIGHFQKNFFESHRLDKVASTGLKKKIFQNHVN